MHHHLEIVMPPDAAINAAITSILAPFDECQELNEDGDVDTRNTFWDFWVIGGRWAGNKFIQAHDKAVKAFDEWSENQDLKVKGFQCGKQELATAEMERLVDQKWAELVDGDPSEPCPLFKHSNDQYAGDLHGTLEGDVWTLDKCELTTADRVIFAAPSYDHQTEQHNGSFKANYMRTTTIWNGCNHEETTWDKTIKSALRDYRQKVERYLPRWFPRGCSRSKWS